MLGRRIIRPVFPVSDIIRRRRCDGAVRTVTAILYFLKPFPNISQEILRIAPGTYAHKDIHNPVLPIDVHVEQMVTPVRLKLVVAFQRKLFGEIRLARARAADETETGQDGAATDGEDLQ